MTVLLMLATLIVFLVVDYMVQRKEAYTTERRLTGVQLHLPWENIPAGFGLATNHLWVREESDGSATLGVDRFLSALFGAPEAIALPERGTPASPDVRSIALQRGGKTLRFAVPIAGTVTETNAKVSRDPSLMSADPYGEGWLMRVQPDAEPKRVAAVFHGSAAKAWLLQQIALVKDFLSGQIPGTRYAMIQDGGVPVHGILQQCDERTWNDFQDAFGNLKNVTSTQGEQSHA